MDNGDNCMREHSKDLTQLSRFNLKDRQLFDLELIMVGGFAPLTGFMSEADYHSVLTHAPRRRRAVADTGGA